MRVLEPWLGVTAVELQVVNVKQSRYTPWRRLGEEEV
jgi:hypothetical protein